jgi:hypothetical protein
MSNCKIDSYTGVYMVITLVKILILLSVNFLITVKRKQGISLI